MGWEKDPNRPYTQDKRWVNGERLRHVKRLASDYFVSPTVNIAAGDIIPLAKVRTRSRLENLTVRWLHPGLAMDPAAIAFSGTFAAVDPSVQPGGVGEANDLVPYVSANDDATATSFHSRLWFTNFLAAADHLSALPRDFRIAPTAFANNDELWEVEAEGYIDLLKSPATSVYCRCSNDPWTTGGATVAGGQLVSVMGCGDGHMSVGEILMDSAAGDPRNKDGTRRAAPLDAGATHVDVFAGNAADDTARYCNATYKRFAGAEQVYACLVVRTAITVAQQAGLAIEITVDEIDPGASVRTEGSAGFAENVRGQG
jgi:hypothetical protein